MVHRVKFFVLFGMFAVVIFSCSNSSDNGQVDSFTSKDTLNQEDKTTNKDQGQATDTRINDVKVTDKNTGTDHACRPKTCQELGWECGEGDNGCGEVLQCGGCPDKLFCGEDHKCSKKPRFCGNNTCNEDENCGNCPEDCACGGGQVCFHDHCCPPMTCNVLDWECGKGDDGCGGIVDCGNCDADHMCVDHKCKMKPKCGDGECNGNENCSTCKADCMCKDSEVCENGTCKGLDSDHEWVDHSTGLMWEATPKDKHIKWYEADAYCKGLEIDGYKNWRIPTIDELRSLIRGCEYTVVGGDCKVGSSCTSASCGDPDECREGCPEGEGPGTDDCYWTAAWIKGACNKGSYWSSTLVSDQAATVWVIRFDTGAIRTDSKNWRNYVRCVRDAE